MKKTRKSSKTNDLLIDVMEYMFTEWLVRRGIFTAYKSNYKRAFQSCDDFRNHLRGHIRRSLHGPIIGPSHLISSSFLYTSTPEGVKFWTKQSAAWERFYAEFQVKF